MSLIKKKEKKKKRKYPRANHRNYHSQNKFKTKRKIYRMRGWKLNYPDLFEEIPNYPYIVRKPN